MTSTRPLEEEVGRRHPIDDRGCGPTAIGSDLMGIGPGVRGGGVFKELQVGWRGHGPTAQADRRARLRVEERLRHGARDVHRHGSAERIDQAHLILNWATMALRDGPASRQQKAGEYQQTLHFFPLIWLNRQAARARRRQS